MQPALTILANMLGIAPRLAEDALHSESAARAVLTRRDLFAAGAALAAGSVFVGGPLPLHVFFDGCTWYAAHSWADYKDLLRDHLGIPTGDDEYDTLADTLVDSHEERDLSRQMNVCWDPIEQEITDSGGHSLRASLDFWAKREGRGVLFGTEY